MLSSICDSLRIQFHLWLFALANLVCVTTEMDISQYTHLVCNTMGQQIKFLYQIKWYNVTA